VGSKHWGIQGGGGAAPVGPAFFQQVTFSRV